MKGTTQEQMRTWPNPTRQLHNGWTFNAVLRDPSGNTYEPDSRLTLPQVDELRGYSKGTSRAYINSGRLPAHKATMASKEWLVYAADAIAERNPRVIPPGVSGSTNVLEPDLP